MGEKNRYAATTRVPVAKSKGEIEALLARYGASEFGYRSSAKNAEIGFKARGRLVRMALQLPGLEAFRSTPHGRSRTDAQARKHWEQAARQRWRALKLVLQAKLEAVESGITTFEIEFLPHFVVPGGRVFHDVALPQIEAAYTTGRLPPLLGSGGE